jgi:hypothetical protein
MDKEEMSTKEWTCENVLQGDTTDPREALHAASFPFGASWLICWELTTARHNEP